MKIKAILHLFYSNRDRAGNVSWAFRWINPITGQRIEGRTNASENNIYAAARLHGLNGTTYYAFEEGMGYRLWVAKTRDWPYAGCNPEEIIKFVTKELEKSIQSSVA